MGSSIKDSSSPGVGACPQPARHAELEELDSYAGYCVGLGPVLEAVDELPPSGSPIPASAQSRVKQFFTQQLSTDTGTAPRPLRIRPPELQDLKQLHKSLQQHAKTFRYEGAFQVPPIVVAAAQLVADAVRQVARQQVLEKNSPAYGVLLDEGYRAGVMAVGCAGLRAILKLRITTPTQLAQACAVAVQSISKEPLSAKPAASSPAQIMPSDADDTLSFAWHHLKAFYCSSNSSSSSSSSGGPPWKLSRGAVVSVLQQFVCDLCVAAAIAWVANARAAGAFDSCGAAGSGSSSAGSIGTPAAASPPPPAAAAIAAVAPASQPVAVKASSSGVVVATSSRGKTAVAARGKKAVADASAGTSSSSSTTTTTTNSSSSKATDPELLVPANLKRWYCSPDTFDMEPVVPLPQAVLGQGQLLVKLQLHTEYRDHGWNALHYACASHRIDLVEQLLAAGASVSEPEDNALLQPLHLACMGRIRNSAQFYRLLGACNRMSKFQSYGAGGDSAEMLLVALLLSNGACPNARASKPGSKLEGLTPLHILSCWDGGIYETEVASRELELVFHNPFVGKACMLCSGDLPAPSILLHHATADLDSARVTGRSLRFPGEVDAAVRLSGPERDKVQPSCEAALEWGSDLLLAVAHVTTLRTLCDYGATPDLAAGPLGETPLMIAAAWGNAAVTAALLLGGADPELTRADGARALEIAVHYGYVTVGWTLLCYGAQALPSWAVSGRPHPLASAAAKAPASLTHELLVCNTVKWRLHAWSRFSLQRLLADGAGLEGVWPETGETPLLMAIRFLDAELVRMLVQAGADLNARVATGPDEGASVIMHLLKASWRETPSSKEESKEILQILIDAGADLHSWRDEGTGYNLVQTAANMQDVDAALQLVEAGCKWQLPKGQRVLGNAIFYAPEILTTHSPNLKLALVEGRFRLAEKVGRQKRAATASALQPWLSPDVTPECKEATLRCLVAAGVTPGHHLYYTWLRRRTPAPPPRVEAPCAGVQAQRAAAAAAAAAVAAAGRSTRRSPAEEAAAAAAAAEAAAAAAPPMDERTRKEMEAAMDSIVMMDSDEADAVFGRSKGGSKKKKKKKETAAQREARQKQQRRIQQLQNAGSGSDSDREGEGSGGSRDTAGSSAAAAAEAVAATADSTGAGAQEQPIVQGPAAASDVLQAQQQADQQQKSPKQQQQQQQQEQQAQNKQQKGQQGKATGQQEQQQARASSSGAAAAPAPAGAASAHGPNRQPAQQQSTVAPPAAAPAVPAAAAQHTRPSAMAAMLKAANTDKARRVGAGTLTPAARPEQQLQQQEVAAALQDAAVSPPAAEPDAAVQLSAVAGPQPNPSAATSRPAAFLPPHLRMSMPAAAATGVAPAAGGPRAVAQAPTMLPVQRTLPMPGQAVPQVVQPVAMQPAAAAAAAAGKAAGLGAAAGDAGGGSKGPKLCLVCAQRRRNVLLIPCRHLVLCAECAEQLHGQGQLSSCPHCKKPCKQHIRVHQS